MSMYVPVELISIVGYCDMHLWTDVANFRPEFLIIHVIKVV